MLKYFLCLIFVLCNTISIFCVWALWNVNTKGFNGMGGGSLIIATLIFGSIGYLIGGYQCSKNLYKNKSKQIVFSVLAAVVFVGLYFSVASVKLIGGILWPSMSVLWIYLIITTLWMLLEITRDRQLE